MKRLIILCLLAIITIVCLPDIAAAVSGPSRNLEVTYIPFAGEPAPTKTISLPAYVKYLYHGALGICGFVALGVLVYAGFQYFSSAGDPEKIKDSKNRIFSAILGLGILLLSWIILSTINPQLVVLRLPDELPPILPNLNPGVYLCKERVDIEGFWRQRQRAESQSPEEQKRIVLGLEQKQKAIDNNCYIVGGQGGIRKTFNDEVDWVYFVPAFREKQYGVVLYEETGFGGSSMVIYGDGNQIKDLENPVEWLLPDDFFASSAKPFFFNFRPDPSWYVSVFQLIDYNRGEPAADGKCWAVRKFAGCDDMDIDGVTYYLNPGLGPFQETGSVKIEGDLIAIFFKNPGSWTLESEIDVYTQSDTDLNNNKMGDWREDCVEEKGGPAGSFRDRSYPCADRMIIVSAEIY